MLTSSTTQSSRLLAAQLVDGLSDCVSWALPRGLGALLPARAAAVQPCPWMKRRPLPRATASCYFYLFSCEMQVTRKILSPAVCKALKEELSIR